VPPPRLLLGQADRRSVDLDRLGGGFILIGDSWWQLANAGILAAVMTQLSFLGHDAAHRQIFKSGRWNDWVSLIIANLLVGISYGWWQSKHNRHHANPNKEGADPDIALTALRPHSRTSNQASPPTDEVAGGPSRLVLLPNLAARRCSRCTTWRSAA
jgi:hypothetical protein